MKEIIEYPAYYIKAVRTMNIEESTLKLLLEGSPYFVERLESDIKFNLERIERSIIEECEKKDLTILECYKIAKRNLQLRELSDECYNNSIKIKMPEMTDEFAEKVLELFPRDSFLDYHFLLKNFYLPPKIRKYYSNGSVAYYSYYRDGISWQHLSRIIREGIIKLEPKNVLNEICQYNLEDEFSEIFSLLTELNELLVLAEVGKKIIKIKNSKNTGAVKGR